MTSDPSAHRARPIQGESSVRHHGSGRRPPGGSAGQRGLRATPARLHAWPIARRTPRGTADTRSRVPGAEGVVEARPFTGVAGNPVTLLIDLHQQDVTVAIGDNFHDALGVARRLALVPLLAAAA